MSIAMTESVIARMSGTESLPKREGQITASR